MSNNKMSFSRTPRKTPPPETAEQFIEGAGKPPEELVPTWESLDDKKRRSPFNVRLTDAEQEKLRFIATHTPDSMHEFCLKALVPAINAKIAELMEKEGGQ